MYLHILYVEGAFICFFFQFIKRAYWYTFREGMHNVTTHFSSALSHVRLFVTPWTAAHQAFLSITNSLSLFKLMSIESVVPSSHLILCRPLLLLLSIFPSITASQMSQFFASSDQSIGLSALASVLSMNIQD